MSEECGLGVVDGAKTVRAAASGDYVGGRMDVLASVVSVTLRYIGGKLDPGGEKREGEARQ